MPTINGTFICLHSCTDSPYYNPLEFSERLCLADCFSGGYATSTDSYSVTNLTELERRFGEINACKKLFFTESNSAHHMTYFTARRVFEQLRESKTTEKYLVVNFDQHQDYSVRNSKTIFFCGSWGGWVTTELKADYFIIGEGGTDKDSHLYRANSGKTVFKSNSELDKIMAEINKYDKIYVTVDMDVLISDSQIRRTNWKSGKLQTDVLLSMLSRLPRTKIVAADITGFPPRFMISGEPVPDTNRLNGYIADIESVAQTLLDFMG